MEERHIAYQATMVANDDGVPLHGERQTRQHDPKHQEFSGTRKERRAATADAARQEKRAKRRA